jgi:hypothetical protein
MPGRAHGCLIVVIHRDRGERMAVQTSIGESQYERETLRRNFQGQAMLFPAVLVFLAVYWTLALVYRNWLLSRGKKVSLIGPVIICLLLLFGDHIAGYIWFKVYTTTISVSGPVSVITGDLAVEDYAQDIEQKIEEGGGGGGWPPIISA